MFIYSLYFFQTYLYRNSLENESISFKVKKFGWRNTLFLRRIFQGYYSSGVIGTTFHLANAMVTSTSILASLGVSAKFDSSNMRSPAPIL